MPEAKSAITDVKPGGRGRTPVAPAVAPAPTVAAPVRKGKAPPLTLTQQRAAARDAVKATKTAKTDAATALKAHQKLVKDADKAVGSKKKALALAETAKLPKADQKAAVKLAKEELKTAERTLKDLGKATPKLEAADAKAKAAYDAATAAKLKIETDRLGAA